MESPEITNTTVTNPIINLANLSLKACLYVKYNTKSLVNKIGHIIFKTY